MPVPYCTATDVLRRFDPTLTVQDLGSGIIGLDDPEQVRTRIQAVSQEFDQDTGTALRERRVGSPGAPNTYEHHDADRQRRRYPLRVELDHDDIVPIDPEEDTIELRTGRDSWEDVTSNVGNEWVLLNETGELKLFRYLVRLAFFEAPDERFFRATYRYGALGGGRDRGGQTTLASSIDSSATTLDVADTSRLPADGGVLLLPDPDPAGVEYVRATNVDTANNTLEVTRGVRSTVASSHDADTPVHYCPQDVRDAVAAQAAVELSRSDLSLQRQDGDDARVDPGTKIDDWQAEFERAKARYSAVRRM